MKTRKASRLAIVLWVAGTLLNTANLQSQDMYVYQELALNSPWINVSWSATVDFASTEKFRQGATSTKVAAGSWGALSVHHGSWGSPGFDRSLYDSVAFYVYTDSANTKLNVILDNDADTLFFPRVACNNGNPLPTGVWFYVSIAMIALNPDSNTPIHRLSIENAGSATTFYVDDIRFVGAGDTLLPPTLASPANNATGVPTNPTLSWNASTGATSYRLQVSTSSLFTSTVVDQDNITGTSHAVSGLSYSTTYYWRVNASNSGGTSNWSTVWNFTTTPPPPSPPTLTSPANNATDVPTNPTLSWNASSGAASYRLQVSTNSLFTSTVVDSSNITGTSHAVSGLSNSTTYYWRVNATNAAGTSDWSSAWNFTTADSTPPPGNIWVTAYYAGWMQGQANNGHLPADSIDYTAMSHIIHFALVPRSDGTIDSTSNSITVANSQALIPLAHSSNVKVLIAVGGWATETAFLGATNDVNRANFISRLKTFMIGRGYDGIDVDWERLKNSHLVQYEAFIAELRDSIGPSKLLTAAVEHTREQNEARPMAFARLKDYFDQINIMTYDMSGAWPGWVTWHNAAIFDGGYVFPSTGGPVPSADGEIDYFISKGVPTNKLGIGLDFYGYVWSGGSGTSTGGVTEPRQSWTTAPSVQVNVPYYDIMQNYYQPQYNRWDEDADAAYLSINDALDINDRFISFDDETTCVRKVQYSKTKGIGGLIIWELGGGYLPASFPNRDRLLQAVKNAWNGGSPGSAANLSEPLVFIAQGKKPVMFELRQNYPNPFNPTTTIEYRLSVDGHVSLVVYDILGRRVATLVDQHQHANHYRIVFDARPLSAGVYLYRLQSGSFVDTKTLLLIK